MWKQGTVKQVKKMLFCIMVILIALYAVNAWLLYRDSDSAGPELTFDESVLEVSITSTEEELLAGVTAVDKKDGDVSDTVMIESMSKMLEGNQRVVTYAAFDKDGHAGKAERRIQYTDYTAPRFSLTGPLEINMSSSDFSVTLQPLHATDCIDGDISDQIIVVNTELENMSLESMSGIYEVQVTNSCGDVASLKLPIKMDLTGESTSTGNAQILLSEYLIYTKVGEVISPADYVQAAIAGGYEYSAGEVLINSSVDVNTPGVYTVTYSVENGGNKATVDLIVVVEG